MLLIKKFILECKDTERKEIEAFLAGKKSSTINRMIKYRTKKFLPIIKEEIKLSEKLLEKK